MAWFGFDRFGLNAAAFVTRHRVGFEISLSRSGRSRTAPPPATSGPDGSAVPTARAGVSDSLAAEIASHTWYHTIDLGNGVRTPGFYDHDPILAHYRLPESLAGLRVLDVATFDGYWAFEFERRGAAEVVALDLSNAGELDLAPRRRAAMGAAELAKPFGRGFEIAARERKSRVRRIESNVYALSPEVHGTFDLVHVGDLLLHLRDPILALQRVRAVTRGRALISDCYWPEHDHWPEQLGLSYERGEGENIWWRLGSNTLAAMIGDAGFAHVEALSRFRYGGRGRPHALWHVVFDARP